MAVSRQSLQSTSQCMDEEVTTSDVACTLFHRCKSLLHGVKESADSGVNSRLYFQQSHSSLRVRVVHQERHVVYTTKDKSLEEIVADVVCCSFSRRFLESPEIIAEAQGQWLRGGEVAAARW